MKSSTVVGMIGGSLMGAGLGAGLMYLLDPDRGNRRRSQLKDRIDAAKSSATEGVQSTASDLGNRAKGAVAEVTRRFREEPVSDRTLEERVRSALGRVVSNPTAVDVRSEQGRIVLSGPVLDEEASDIVATVEEVPGVESVIDLFDRRDDAERVPALRGSDG